MHLTVIIVVPGCLALGWWQLHRALSGNTLSWAYAFEWPFFAAYGVYLWWKLVHERPDAPANLEAGVLPAEVEDGHGLGNDEAEDEEDEELAAYNRYLAELSASDDRKRR